MALRAVMSSKVPMVIILGATGTGKTKLSVELAQKFAAEIISADSMQIYKGLNVVTAKASKEEREAAPHHLLDILEPHQMFTVVDFRNRALKIIDTLTKQGKIPIVVGGTNYYIESIVYNILVEHMDDSEALLWNESRRKRLDNVSEKNEENEKKKQAIEAKSEKDEDGDVLEKPSTSDTSGTEFQMTKEQLQKDVDNEINFTNEEIHAKLHSIDPQMAKRLHPNNRRKILRSIEHAERCNVSPLITLETVSLNNPRIEETAIDATNAHVALAEMPLDERSYVSPNNNINESIEVYLKTGRRHSEILAEQKISEGQLRRPGATIIFWLKCEKTIHDQRLFARVDSMIKEGLIQELLDFHDKHNKQRIQDGKPPDYTKGVFQTLGFKEFHDYLMLSDEERNSDAGKKLLQQSIENMKMGTRRYAHRQNKMIRGRFLEHPTREIPPIYELDTTDITKWDHEVKNKAVHILESFLNESPCDYEPLKSEIDEITKAGDGNSHNYCEVCSRIFIGDNVYAIHLKSIRHNKVLKKKKQLEEQMKKMEEKTNDPDPVV